MSKAHDKLRVWGSDVDEGTRAQARRATRLPFVPGHVALMPDAHVGIGATVGSVIPTEGAIVPSFAGVDLGCGMVATETVYSAGDLPDDLGPLMSLVLCNGMSLFTVARQHLPEVAFDDSDLPDDLACRCYPFEGLRVLVP